MAECSSGAVNHMLSRMILVPLFLLLLLDIGSSQHYMFNPVIGRMFQSIASQVIDTIHNGNASCADALLSKMTLLNGGMVQLTAMTENTTAEIFHTYLPVVKTVLAKGKPEYARIKFSDQELLNKFNFSSTSLQRFRTLHAHIGQLIAKLEKITDSKDVSVAAIESENVMQTT